MTKEEREQPTVEAARLALEAWLDQPVSPGDGEESAAEFITDIRTFEAAVRRDERERFVRAINQARVGLTSDIKLSSAEEVAPRE